MNDTTILYYSASVENEVFEENVRRQIQKNSNGLPILSITQKPVLDFGKNICVGVHHPCYANEFRQIQIGLKQVKTPYVLTAEADFLYPPEYFSFIPTGADYYRYANVWVNYIRFPKNKPNVAYFKLYSDGAQAIKTDFWLNCINKSLGTNTNHWFSKSPDSLVYPSLITHPQNTWTSKNPALTFKTNNNVSRYTSTQRSQIPRLTLEYWGNVDKLSRSLFIK